MDKSSGCIVPNFQEQETYRSIGGSWTSQRKPGIASFDPEISWTTGRLRMMGGSCAGSGGSFTPSKASSSASTAVFATPLPETKLFKVHTPLPPAQITLQDDGEPEVVKTFCHQCRYRQIYGKRFVLFLRWPYSTFSKSSRRTSRSIPHQARSYMPHLITSGAGPDSHNSGHPKPFKCSIKPRSAKAVALIKQNVYN
ncbi:hypothetical protein EV424DRAFT_1343675 [Suillus variegatus]|nr:hypothetical protein EV424DRAFT_1343675 [Suillus variegatus]